MVDARFVTAMGGVKGMKHVSISVRVSGAKTPPAHAR